MAYNLKIPAASITELLDVIDEDLFYLSNNIRSVIECINDILYYCDEFEKKIEKEKEDITVENVVDFISDIKDEANDASNLLE